MQLCLPDGLFWLLTPRLFAKLCDQFQQQQYGLNLRAGFIAAQYYNAKRTEAKQKVWTAFEFFPQQQPKAGEQSDEEMLVAMEMWVRRTKDLCH